MRFCTICLGFVIDVLVRIPELSGQSFLLILSMMGLGMTLKYIPEIPSAFTAAFYSALGPMLFLSSVRFISNMK